MTRETASTFPGRILKTDNGFKVQPFIFEGKPEPLILDCPEGAAAEGDIAACRADTKNCKAFYTGLIAKAGTAIADLYMIAEKNCVTIPYPAAVLAETCAICLDPCIDDPLLVDLTDKAFITIDNEDSRDLDQALFLEQTGKGFNIYYALADAAFYIRPGTALFAEALKRGTTYYFPGFSVPMLPPELSEGVLSLNPGVDRRAFVFILEMDPEGGIMSSKCFQGRIHSRAKLSYNGVQVYYDNPQASALRGKEFTAVLDLLKQAGEIRIGKDVKSNRVQFNEKETLIRCTADGSAFDISIQVRNACSRYNEQLSLMCNMAGAGLLSEGSDPNVQGIFRIHAEPGPGELDELERTIEEILESHGITEQHMLWDRGQETLAHYMDRLCSLHENKRLVDALERQVLLSMRRSLFTSIAGEHFALAVNPYSRFSSPMREIVGIFIHKEALGKLGLLKHDPVEQDIKLRDKVIEAGNRSRALQGTIEKEVVKCAADRLFRRELTIPIEERTRYSATILGIQATRLYVRFDSPPLELKVYTEDLAQYLKLQPDFRKNCLVCRETGKPLFRVGDEIHLYVAEYRADRWRLVPVS